MTLNTAGRSPFRASARLRALSGRQIALARAGIGVAMLVRPQALPRVLGVDSASAERATWIVQMLGAREVALGVGTWAAVRRGDARLWLTAGLFCDAADSLAVGRALLAGRVAVPTGLGVTVTAALAAAVEAAELLRR